MTCVAIGLSVLQHISTAVHAFVGLHTNRESHSYTCEKFYLKWPYEVTAFLSNDTETLKSRKFLFSSIRVLVAPRVYEVWFSQNDEEEKTSFMRLFLHKMHRLFNVDAIYRSIKNIIISCLYNTKYNSNFYKWKTGVQCLRFIINKIL